MTIRPSGGQPPGRPVGRPGVGRPQGVFGGFSYYLLVMLFFKIVRLIVEFTRSRVEDAFGSQWPHLFALHFIRSPGESHDQADHNNE
jgi:hypothetical protein